MSSKDLQERFKHFIKTYYMLNRVTVSDDMSRFVHELAVQIGANVLSIPSGIDCLTWVIPQKWTVREAYVGTLTGKRVADFARHPLYLASYSAPFSGEVSREELAAHISSDETRPDCLVYDYRWQYEYGEKKEWGFSMPYKKVQALDEERYRVHIDTEFRPGMMDIIDWTIPGESPETIFFAAHTCHPGQVNDGIACIAVIVELFNWLQQKSSRRYTYRMICGPEYFAAAGLLQYGKDVDKLKYGLFLDMPGNGQPLGFSRSYYGDSYIDLVTHNVLEHQLREHIERPYRSLWANDEMFYDGPDFQIPTIGIGRGEFTYYHTDKDDVEHCDFEQLEESLIILQKIVDVLETDWVPKRHYRGPLYLSRSGLYIDPKKDLKGYQSLQSIQILMDGTRSCLEIAQQIGIDFQFVYTFAQELYNRELVSKIRKYSDFEGTRAR